MRRPVSFLTILRPAWSAIAVACLLAPQPASARRAIATVSQVSGGVVYVDAGRKEGLVEGDSLVVLRDARAVAWLKTTYLSSHRAACDTLRTLVALRAGDKVGCEARAVPAQPELAGSGSAQDTTRGMSGPPAPGMAGGTSAATQRRKGERAHLQGRIGLSYLLVDGRDRNRLTQAGLDFRLDGRQIWNAPLDLSVDVRGRRTNFERASGAGTTNDLARVYRFNLSAHDSAGRYVMTLGRQSSSALSLVSIFDGVLAEYRGPRWNSGVFLGAQPEPIRLGPSGSIVEFGGFLEWHQPEASELRWSVSSGLVSSREGGSPNRDFGYTLVYYSHRDFSLSASQEIDVNRGWKRSRGAPLLSPTSSYVTLNMKLIPNLSVRGGYDSRRSVRLYRDHITPETEFDDRFRRGVWGGLALEQVTHLRLGADVRTNAVGGDDRLTTWSGNAELIRLGQPNGALHLRLSRATGIGISNDLMTYGVGLDPLAGCHVELGGGSRRTRNTRFQLQDDSHWQSGGIDLTVMRRGYLNLSIERYNGGMSPGTQVSSGLSWRF